MKPSTEPVTRGQLGGVCSASQQKYRLNGPVRAHLVLDWVRPTERLAAGPGQGRGLGRAETDLDVSAELSGEALLLHILHGGFAPEQIDGHPGGKEALVLLPLQ
ncbi:hypothetical protein JZ751_011321 [Albula glossodonta]|uniref:Uncharacterized protein n=1 Tax=Albula glossodonta TaxID=121402 RepID=A0A8T2N0A8_9TELE|nr:hypothetical protein JZ751_011321 [Albula glossodonta]